ncbi:hypothetical protein MATL_G00096400 [Megalops atlanticus]|uniref:Uncharacterized protein n=1 Tax=Megalops atlanticus TaxID=7932 RepID=A0A9D3Q0Z8_MEGAT|nr:hypothetical protein MATL_G00096400 [Megalops atlanticus]
MRTGGGTTDTSGPGSSRAGPASVWMSVWLLCSGTMDTSGAAAVFSTIQWPLPSRPSSSPDASTGCAIWSSTLRLRGRARWCTPAHHSLVPSRPDRWWDSKGYVQPALVLLDPVHDTPRGGVFHSPQQKIDGQMWFLAKHQKEWRFTCGLVGRGIICKGDVGKLGQDLLFQNLWQDQLEDLRPTIRTVDPAVHGSILLHHSVPLAE